MLNAMYRFLISLSTVFWIFALMLGLMLAGSLMLPSNLSFFSGIDDEPLFGWLASNNDLSRTWWIWAIIAAIAALGLSTLVCTADFLMKKLTRHRFLLRITPQVMHAGVLFVMLGHLLTGSFGFKNDYTLQKGGEIEPLDGIRVSLVELDLTFDEYGLAVDWAARLKFAKGGTERTDEIRPSAPLYFGGLGFYFKSVAMEKEPQAVLRVSQDPGAVWAFVGGMLLILGGLGFIYARWKGGVT